MGILYWIWNKDFNESFTKLIQVLNLLLRKINQVLDKFREHKKKHNFMVMVLLLGVSIPQSEVEISYRNCSKRLHTWLKENIKTRLVINVKIMPNYIKSKSRDTWSKVQVLWIECLIWNMIDNFLNYKRNAYRRSII